MPFRNLLFIATLLSCSAFATNGVLEINADCAEVGCFQGDGAGLPVTITRSGSYRLTGNLTTDQTTQQLIQIDGSDISIGLDLNGFTLQGPVTCIVSGPLFPICDASGNGHGISSTSSASSGSITYIHNGTITGVGGFGIIGSPTTLKLENLVISENGLGGVRSTPRNATLSNLTVFLNGGSGIDVDSDQGLISNSVSNNNDGAGIDIGYCSNIVAFGNASSNSCTAIAPNQCSFAPDCD